MNILRHRTLRSGDIGAQVYALRVDINESGEKPLFVLDHRSAGAHREIG